ncbi:hypothetical protein DVH24_004177 [Malus domestica]|uniref:Uncharacterized protein n=1 Tax=Malus domestica TaxID=3750 RepID=A0A498JRB8_MALDO|nr:hypothetical protein DVH24_010643 [Malus domestica]RXI03525.1 hypothetical protein DVH24_004177 [Malus domestica]
MLLESTILLKCSAAAGCHCCIFDMAWMIPKGMDKFELALQFGISVLVVACPFAMGLAIPTAVMITALIEGEFSPTPFLITIRTREGKIHPKTDHGFKFRNSDSWETVVNAVLVSNYSIEEFCAVSIATEACGRQKYVETGRKVHNLVSALTVFNCDFVLNTRIITMCNVRFSFGFPLSFRRAEEEELVPVECAC